MKLTKKKYERPKVELFELKQTSSLLTLSNPGEYENGGDPLGGSAPSYDDVEILF